MRRAPDWFVKVIEQAMEGVEIPELTVEEEELGEWVENEAEEAVKARYHAVDDMTKTAYKQGFTRGFYFLYNKLNA